MSIFVIIFYILANLSLIDLNYKITELKKELEDTSKRSQTLNYIYFQKKNKFISDIINNKNNNFVKIKNITFIRAYEKLSKLTGSGQK